MAKADSTNLELKEYLKSLLTENIMEARKPTGSLSEILGYVEQGAENAEKIRLYEGNRLDDTYGALTNLLKVSDSEEGMKTYEKKLGEFASDAQKFGGFDDNIVQAETLKLLGNQKKQMHGDFSMAIQGASDFINTDQFLDTADEFVNIQDTIDRLNKEHLNKIDFRTGEKYTGKLHVSVANFLQSELANANALHDNMAAGFQFDQGEIVGTNFRYNKAETNDKETFRKLNLYRDRLDLAVKSLAGDKMISPEEAEAILIGDQKHYLTTKADALRKAEYNYKANKAMVIQYDDLINAALQKKLSADDVLNMQGLTDAQTLDMKDNFTAGSWDKIVQQLTDKQGEYQELKNTANQNYKNWYGSFFEELKGGISDDDIDWATEKIESKEDVKRAVKAIMKKGRFGIDLPEKDVTPEQIAETKKIQRQAKGVLSLEKPEDPELYSSSEKILEGYIKGDVSASSLREIGGQSLVSDADRIKSAAKGQKPMYTVIPGVKTKERAPIDVETLKTLNFTSKAGKYSWDDVVNKIYGKKSKGLSVVDDYLSGDIKIEDLKITYRTRRDRARKIKQQFKKLNISLEEFKKKYSKDYETLINLLGKSKAK